ncbi:MAG: glycerol-3-phosphate acyltransferase [Eubacteriales bacterium]
MWKLILMVIIGYLVGSVNLSILVTKYIGKVDLREIGSGNAGGTNVVRAMGSAWGICVIVAEMLKGAILGGIARFLFPGDIFSLGEIGGRIVGEIVILGVLIGNVLPCFHNFKGGKGASVCASAMLVLDYRVFIIVMSVFFIAFLASRMVSLGSISAALSAPIAVFLLWADPFHGFANAAPYWYVLVILTALVAAILIFRHRTNISRILNGTENKFKLWKKD